MARGIFTSVHTESNIDLDGVVTPMAPLNIGSKDSGLNSAGSVSVQFTCAADVVLLSHVRSDETVPWVTLDPTQFVQTPDTGTFAAGDHIVQVNLPVCSEVYFSFTGTGIVSDIRINVQ